MTNGERKMTGDDLKMWRKSLYLSQASAAARLNVTRATILRWEQRRELPRAAMLALFGELNKDKMSQTDAPGEATMTVSLSDTGFLIRCGGDETDVAPAGLAKHLTFLVTGEM